MAAQPFLLNPANRVYLDGGRASTWPPAALSGCLLVFFACFLVNALTVSCLAVALFSGATALVLSTRTSEGLRLILGASVPTIALLGLFFFGGIGGLVWTLRTVRRQTPKAREGQLIGGRLIEAQLRHGPNFDTWLEASYEFVSPATGVLLTGKSRRRTHPRGTPPPPGTPVAVLYSSDHHYSLL